MTEHKRGRAEPVLATPAEYRARVDGASTLLEAQGCLEGENVAIPHASQKFPDGQIKVRLETLVNMDRLALLGGFRISELVTRHGPDDGNTSDTLHLKEEKHFDTDQPVLLIQVRTLKKKSSVIREVGVPLDPEYEPWAKPVLDAWNRNENRNFCNMWRSTAYLANRILFDGLGYKVRSRVVYRVDADGKPLRGEKGRRLVDRVVPEHVKPGSNHMARHIRARELRQLQFTREERVSFFKWSPGLLEGSAMMDDYDQPEWFEWFPKLLRKSATRPSTVGSAASPG